MNILLAIISIILSPLVLIIYLIKPIIHFRFSIMPIDRFAALLIYINYLIEKEKVYLNKKSIYSIDIIALSRTSSNKILRAILIKNNKFYNSILVRFVIESLNFFLGKNNNHVLNVNNTLATNILNFNINKKINIDFIFKDIELILKKFNLNKNSKWICVHNRDSEYLKKLNRIKNFSYHNYRDFDILSYSKLVQYFLDKNYYVFRVGKTSDQYLSIKNDKYFDLPNHIYKNDIFDLYILLNCKLFIGCDSGPWTIPYLNRKFILKTNYTTIGILEKMKHNNFVFIFKRFRDIKNRKLLSIREIFQRKLDNVFNSEIFLKEKIELIPNDEITIFEAGKELEKIESDIFTESNQEKELQQKFWDLINKYSTFKNSYPVKARVSNYFLKNNLDLFN
jgi:putative glycosyltransferase (TIGR04372 family)